jgi:hypothetical protein
LATTGPSNTGNAATITAAATTGPHGAVQNRTALTSGVPWTFSAYLCWDGVNQYAYLCVYDASNNYYSVVFDLVNGVVTKSATGGTTPLTGVSARIVNCTNATVNTTLGLASGGYFRASITFTSATTAYNFAVGGAGSSGTPTLGTTGVPSWAGTGNEILIVYGCQAEPQPNATSYILNIRTNANAVRAADSLTNSTLTWYNAPAGTAIMVFDATNLGTSGAQQNIFSIGTTTSLGIDAGIATGTSNVVGQFDGNATTSLGSISYATQAKVAVAYNGTTNAACLNGGTVVSPATIASITSTPISTASSFFGPLFRLNESG